MTGKTIRTFLAAALSISGTMIGGTTIAGTTIAGCGGSESRAETPSPSETDRSADEMGLAAEESETTGEEPEPPPPPVTVVAGERTQIEGPTPTLRIAAPRANQVIRTGNVMVRLQVRNWDLESPQGPHVHLIVDNEPYIAIRDVSQPLDVNALVQEHLGHELAEGTHVIRMFPSRGHHESVKDPGAFGMVVFHYRTRTEGFEFDPAAPLLTYSRPKGCNPVGERVLLDFYLTNTELAEDGNRVHWTIDGQSGDITQWAPHWIENLQEGEHDISLELRGPDGNPIPGAFNTTTRTFTVASSCPS
ncbi:MAG: hypothetical protein M3Y87_15985 [Myxococcota bacterium]|nr:hypothetical protein [Myxococcota bacterium]